MARNAATGGPVPSGLALEKWAGTRTQPREASEEMVEAIRVQQVRVYGRDCAHEPTFRRRVHVGDAPRCTVGFSVLSHIEEGHVGSSVRALYDGR
eukprot:3414477-Prymnesium_polylepis.1